MKKICSLFLTISFFVIGLVGTAYAIPILNEDGGIEDINGSAFSYYVNSGELMFIKIGENNDGNNFNNGTVEGYVEDWLSDNRPDLVVPDFILTQSGGTIFTQVSDNQSGTWTVFPVGNVISFYAVKAGNDYAMYLVDPAAATGSWSTYDLFINGSHPETADSLEISHFTAYNPTTAPVPEPTTTLLIGLGVAGLAGVTRRKKKA